MRTLIRYTVFFAVLVGLAFASVTVRVDGRTLFERFRDEGLTPWIDRAKASWVSWTKPEPKPARKASRKRRPKPARQNAGARRQVAILRAATEKAAPKVDRVPSKKRKTRVDPHISPSQKKALDELVSERVGRE